MTNPPDMLQKLRRTVLTHAIDGLPDLAALASELSASVESCRGRTDTGLAALLARARGHEQWLLGEHRQPRVSMMLMTWPANFSGPVQEPVPFWSIELVLQGALRIEHVDGTDEASATSCDWLGVGDFRIIQPARNGIGRCRTRNLSKSDTAVTLHVFGASPASYLSSAMDEQPVPAIDTEQHSLEAGGRPRQPEQTARQQDRTCPMKPHLL